VFLFDTEEAMTGTQILRPRNLNRYRATTKSMKGWQSPSFESLPVSERDL